MVSNGHALNRLLREQNRIQEKVWMAEHYEPSAPRDPEVIVAEEAEIARRRQAFGFH